MGSKRDNAKPDANKRPPLLSLREAQKRYGAENTTFPRPVYVPPGICQWCGKPVGAGRRAFCGIRCSRSFDRAAVWSARGGYACHIMRRDNFTCRECGEFHAKRNRKGLFLPASDGMLEIHHVVPVAQGGGDMPENLVTLCRECHKKVYYVRGNI